MKTRLIPFIHLNVCVCVCVYIYQELKLVGMDRGEQNLINPPNPTRPEPNIGPQTRTDQPDGPNPRTPNTNSGSVWVVVFEPEPTRDPKF